MPAVSPELRDLLCRLLDCPDARTGPTYRPWPMPGDTVVEMTAPAAEARRQWCRLWGLGVWVISVTARPGGLLRVVYAVPAGVRLA